MEMENAQVSPIWRRAEKNKACRSASRQSDDGQTPRKSRNIHEAMELVFHAVFLLCGIVAVAFVLFISLYLIVSGLPAIREIGLVDSKPSRVPEPASRPMRTIAASLPPTSDQFVILQV